MPMDSQMKSSLNLNFMELEPQALQIWDPDLRLRLSQQQVLR
jgi:hypothetical protein